MTSFVDVFWTRVRQYIVDARRPAEKGAPAAPSSPTVEERGNVSRICEIMTKLGGSEAIWDARKLDRSRDVLKIVSEYMKAYDNSRKSFWPVQIDKAAVEGWTEDSVWSNAPAIKDLLVKFKGYSGERGSPDLKTRCERQGRQRFLSRSRGDKVRS